MKKSPPPKKASNKKIPDRYSVKSVSDGTVLTCLESPNLSVRISRGRVFSESSARKAPERTVYLDGACDSPPFLDNKRQVYNLDHHTGIIRSFTLSTCEQASILVMKGLDLSEKNWNIWANDPDLDTVLAIWVLLNHYYISDNNSPYAQLIIPILRLEGLIDGLGLELTHFTAFPKKLLEDTWQKIDALRQNEVNIKQSGKWEDLNFLEYTIQVLKKIDELVFHPDDFKDFKGLDELARCELDDKTSAVVYSANMGIYEIEQHLNRMYGRNPGLIVLERNPGHYTIRKSDIFTPIDINQIYDRLNLYDRYVDGRRPGNRWGGAGDIGGSPRETGTSLSPTEIAQIARESFRKPNILEKITRITWIGFLGLGLPLLSWILIGFSRISDTYSYWILESLGLPLELFACVIIVYTVGLFTIISGKKFWFFGGKYPSGNDWWFFLPGILLGAVLGGSWIPSATLSQGSGSILDQWILPIGLCLLLPVFIEVLFRGILHGLLAGIYRIQISGGDWFLSHPVIISTIIYSLVIFLVPVYYDSFVDRFIPQASIFTRLVGSLFLGLSSGLCRERSESVLPAIAFHSVSLLVTWFLMIVF